MTPEAFRPIAVSIPHQPGVYRYFNTNNEIIYVGKAKDLRKRVSSYFNKTFAGYKTHELVKHIHRIEFTVVGSEQDAFFLENSLIKEFQPRYNIDLKDDKSFPYIVIKKEPFPRVFLTRRKIKDGSEYLGPFTSVAKVRELLYFIRQHIPLRTCKLNLTEKNIAAGKFKVCLEYHLGNCKGPCQQFQSASDYEAGLQQVKQVLKGRLGGVLQHYKEAMQKLVDNMEFEKAGLIKKKIEHLENYSAKSVVVNSRVGDVDVFAFMKNDDRAFINYMMVRNGSIVQAHTLELNPKLDETDAEVLSFGIAQIRDTFQSDAPEIIVPFEIEYFEPNIRATVAKAGDKKKLVDLGQQNVAIYTEETKRKKMLHLEEKSTHETAKVLQELQADLQLPQLPVHIECFDNSNFQGSYPVSAMVCFKNGVPSKDDYRKFNVKTVEGINDFATMKEVVYRRYKRLKEEGTPLPQLIIIDGGKGQLSAAREGIRDLELDGKMTLVGLAKNIEEIFFPGDSESVKLSYQGDSLQLIRRIRDEVHRFGIAFHRQQRSKGTFKNELENIPGIGKATADMLLKKFRSVKNVKAADGPALEKLVGKAKTLAINKWFSPQTGVPLG
ncbi:MAG: excinuclease ABC subunit UvrC [Chitinophagaceae bacterium]